MVMYMAAWKSDRLLYDVYHELYSSKTSQAYLELVKL